MRIGRYSRHLSGVHYAVLNVLMDNRLSTAQLCRVLSGYPEQEVREAVRFLRKAEFIRRRYSLEDRLDFWEVMI